ncbi:cell division protein SepF [Salininema proteolyticum]|uniref:Cell division protein SepF n=1 Tax=Salininema proteolyticum TaxID=1607685 RepID=A0ABV8TYW5_9ACTN
MGAMRKAGVWLGLIEEEQQQQARHRDVRATAEDDEFGAEETPLARRARRIERTERAERLERAAERAEARPAVRQFNRTAGVTPLREEPEPRPVPRAESFESEPAPAPAEKKQSYRITTLHPATYNEARTIGERYRDGSPVIMNLSELDEADAKRLVDFAAGLVFGTRGSFERVTNRVFLLSPPHVQVTAEDKAKIAEGGFHTQS